MIGCRVAAGYDPGCSVAWGWAWIVCGIRRVADGLVEEFGRVLPRQRKTQRENLALLTATMLDVRSANLMDLAAALPRDADRTDMRYQWISRVLGNTLIDPDTVIYKPI